MSEVELGQTLIVSQDWPNGADLGAGDLVTVIRLGTDDDDADFIVRDHDGGEWFFLFSDIGDSLEYPNQANDLLKLRERVATLETFLGMCRGLIGNGVMGAQIDAVLANLPPNQDKANEQT